MTDTTRTFIAYKEQELETLCRAQHLSLTPQRRALLAALVRRKDHPTADQLYDALKTTVRGLSRTTVYRTLETFASIGLILKVCSQQAKARFDADTSRHHHICCVQCGAVADLIDSNFDLPQLPEEHPSGFRIYDYAITFTGLCPRCRQAPDHTT